MMGRKIATMGRPTGNHAMKLVSRPTKSERNVIASGFAGVPIALPTPPMVAAYAIPRTIAR